MASLSAKNAAVAADLLAEAWQIGEAPAVLSQAIQPRTASDGYRIQELLTSRLELPIAGWKIGCTSAMAQKLLRSPGPFGGRVLATRIYRSGQALPSSAFRLFGVEGEFAFRLGRSLPPRRRAYDPEEVRDAVDAVIPAVEVVDSRYADWLKAGVPSLIADMGCNGALVLGTPLTAWRRLDLSKLKVTMRADGKSVGRGTGAEAMGDPLAALHWLVNLVRGFEGLYKGQVVSTGTCTGIHYAKPGAKIAATFERLGKVAFGFTPPM
jgi:2-keto-4-pentenoate hydratase